MASLTVVSGPAEGRYFALHRPVTVVGRSDRCDAQVVDEAVSSRHFQVRSADGAWHVKDLKSTNGLAINDAQVTGETRLVDGDRIEAGNSVIIFSTRDFPDRDSALAFFKLPGQTDRDTMIQ